MSSIVDIDFNIGEYKTQCPQCASVGNDNSCNNLHVYGSDNDGNRLGAYCFACGFAIPSDEFKESGGSRVSDGLLLKRDFDKLEEKKFSDVEISEIQERTSENLTSRYRGLDSEISKDLGVRWSYDQTTGKVSEMWFPSTVLEGGELVVTGYKIRELPKSFKSVGYVGKANLMGGQTNQVADALIVVAGEIELLTAMKAMESVKRYNKTYNIVTSLLGEDSTADCLKRNYEWVDKHNKIIICMDNDEAGEKAFNKIKGVLDNSKLFKANLKYKDLNEYLKNKEGDQIVKDLYWNAVPLETYGVVGSGSLLQKAKERLQQDKIPFPEFLSELESHLTDNAMWTGEWMNWISSVSSGKSTVIDAWMVDWAVNCPYRQAVLSYESDATSFGVKVASLATARSVMKIEGKENRLAFLESNEDSINYLLVDDNGMDRFDFVDTLPESVEAAKKLVNYLVKVRGVRILWIDPLLDFLSICKNKNEYDDLIMFLDRIRMKYHVNIMTALHTRKNLSSGVNGSSGGEINEEDAYGGREVIAKGTINITAQRNKNAEDYVERNTMVLTIRKSRNDQVTGAETRLFYRAKANKLYPYTYAENRNFFEDDKSKSVEDIVVEDSGFSLNHLGVDDLEEELPF